jgi:hypothetical protein
MTINRRQVLGAAAVGLGGFGFFRFGAMPVHAGTSRNELDGEKEFDEFTADSRRSISKGTDWLIKAINQDGGAGLDIGTTSDVACTSVVGMALLAQGETPVEGRHATRQKRLLEFLLQRIETMGPTGSLQNSRSQIEGDLGPFATHFFAAICLSQMMGEAPNVDRCRRSLQRLADYISAGQHRDGSWGEDAWAPQLATACGWLSLRAANFAGIRVSGSSEKAGDYLIRTMPKLGTSWGDESWYHRFYGTAAGLRVLYSLDRDQEPAAKRALADVMKLVDTDNRAFGGAGGEEYLTFHLLSELLIQMGGENWARWFPTVRDKLVDVQNSDGSWTGHHCITSRTFSTACALLVLCAPNRFLPISQA